MAKRFSSFWLFISGLLCGVFILAIVGFNEDKEASASPVSKCDTACWYPPPLPAEISFAGEPVPLNRWEVKEQLDREILFNYYWQNNILYMLKLSQRHFPVIESILKQNGIPDDFKYLCVAESNLLQAISRSGATGFWQLMKATAPEYNLEISETVDERYNVLKSTEAACKYLKQAYGRFGNWTAAAASYNCGMAGYQNHSSYQGTKNYYELILPEETQRYIFRVLAFKYLMANAEALGFQLSAADGYAAVPTRTLRVTASVSDLADFARLNGSDYKMLKWLNPWLRGRSLKVKPGKAYEILLP